MTLTLRQERWASIEDEEIDGAAAVAILVVEALAEPSGAAGIGWRGFSPMSWVGLSSKW